MINSYIALDLETTGLNPKQDKIIEIGAVRVETGQETGRFHTMLNPHRELEERITELTGIAWDMLKDAPDIVDILEEFGHPAGISGFLWRTSAAWPSHYF